MWRIPLRYGLLASLLFVGWGLLEHELGLNSNYHNIGVYTRPLSMLIFFIVLYIAIRDRKAHQYNVMVFKQGLVTGWYTGLCFSILSTLWLYIYTQYINKGFFTSVVNFKKEQLLSEGYSSAMLNMKIQEIENDYSNPLLHFILFFVFVLGTSMALSALYAYRLQSKKEEIIDFLNKKKTGK
jgi:hypothetical protein